MGNTQSMKMSVVPSSKADTTVLDNVALLKYFQSSSELEPKIQYNLPV